MKFTASAAVVRRLGDQLIRRPRAAFFELVKNAYDADATEVIISVEPARQGEGRIEIKDNGSGMSEQDIREKWCRLASENKVAAPYTDRFRRRRLGEKGIGRFSAAKLGDRLKLTTRQNGASQITLGLDFSQCTDDRDLGDIPLAYREGKPRATLHSGTILRIERLRNIWSRRDIQSLRRDLETLIDPETADQTFHISLSVPWPELSGRLAHPLIGQESHRLKFEVNADGETSFSIHWNGKTKRGTRQGNPPEFGPVRGSIRYFAAGISSSGRAAKVGGSLEDTHLGMKIYRDRCRVRPYGEPKDDWLGLNGKRPDVKRPWSLRHGATAGSVHITTAQNPHLADSSDRESGMDRNRAFAKFVEFVTFQAAILDDLLAQEKRSRTRKEEARARERVLEDLARCITRLESRDYGTEAAAIDRRRKGESGATTTKPGVGVTDEKPPDKNEWRCRSCGLVWRVLKADPAPTRCMESAVDRNGIPRRIPGCGSAEIEPNRHTRTESGKLPAAITGAYATAIVAGKTLHLVISDEMGANEDEYLFIDRTITINGNHKAYRTAYHLDLAAGASNVPEDRRELPAVRTHCAKCACLAWAGFHYRSHQDFNDFENRYGELLELFCEADPASPASPGERGALP